MTFGLSFDKIILIGVIAVLIIGPDKLPQYAASFAQLLKVGVREHKPQHFAQMQIYMHLTGITRAMYLAVNKDTDDLFVERIEVDRAYAERLIDKAYTVSDLSAHYGADEQMARDICQHLYDGAPLPVSVVDALEAGLLALTMDQARHTHSVIDMTATWQRFDGALAGRNGPA